MGDGVKCSRHGRRVAADDHRARRDHGHAQLSGARMRLAGEEIGDPPEGRSASGGRKRGTEPRRRSRESHRSGSVIAALGAAMNVGRSESSWLLPHSCLWGGESRSPICGRSGEGAIPMRPPTPNAGWVGSCGMSPLLTAAVRRSLPSPGQEANPRRRTLPRGPGSPASVSLCHL